MRHVDDYVTAGAVVTGAIVSAALFPRLTVYPIAVATLLPVTAAIVYWLLRAVSVRSAPPHVQRALARVGLHAALFIIGLHVLTVSNLAGVAWARALGPRAVVVLFGAAIMAAGNLLPRIRPNLAIGVRTAHLLENSRLWARVHRRAGHITVALGAVICVAGLSLDGERIGGVVGLTAIAAAVSIALATRRSSDD